MPPEAAKDGLFALKGVTGGRPITARAAAVGALALSPTEGWVFEVTPRTDWTGYPDSLARDVSEPWSPAVQALWTDVVAAGSAKPVAKAAAVAAAAKPSAKPSAKPAARAAAQTAAKPAAKAAAVQKAVQKPTPGLVKGGRGYVKQDFRMVRGKRALKLRCGTCPDHTWDRARGAWVCTACRRCFPGRAGRTKRKKPVA